MANSAAWSPLAALRGGKFASMTGFGQAIVSFLVVFCGYWLYWLIAVPLIEPGLDPEVASTARQEDLEAAAAAPSARKQALAKYFPPGSWELDNPAIWETDTTLLLFKTPRPTADGHVELRHCTLLFFPRSAGEADPQKVRPIIMRASEGATLQFDQAIVLKNVDLAKRQLIGGKLKGQITIVREPSRLGAADDLVITTRDIELKGDRAFSPHLVRFRLGRSHGSGRDLEILLGGDNSPPGGGFRSGKVRTLLLKKDVVMNLAVDDANNRPDRPVPSNSAPQETLKITCGGSFQYDFEHHAASFHERVDVVHLSAGPADMLNCKVLTVFFENDEDQPPAEVQAASPAGPAGGQRPRDLPVRRIEARGDPITLRSPARGIYIQCKGLDYSPAPDGAIGRVLGLGPGVMQASAPNNPAAKYWVQWTREFRFEPAENGQHVALLDGGATVRVANMGEVKANDRHATGGRLVQSGRIFAWMTPLKKPAPPAAVAAVRPVSMQTPPPANREPGSNITWQLERVLAEGDVVIDVPQLSGNTRKLEAWVERPQASPAPNGDQPGVVANEPPPAQRRLMPNANPSQRFDVQAGLIQIKMLPRGEEFSVTNVTLDNQAHLEELTPKPGVKPMVVDGDALHVSGADSDQMRVTVVGKPAKVEAAGAILQGEKIEVEKHTNHLWVNGTGRMLLPMEQDLNGRPLARPQSVEISWQGNMDFQNATVIFDRDVRVASQQQTLTTDKLIGTFDRPIDFSNPQTAAPTGPRNPADTPQLAIVRCIGEAFLDSRELDARGQQTAHDQMKLFDLSIDRTTGTPTSGAISARGPGWVRHVARETSERPMGRPALPGQPRPQGPAGPRPGLTYVYVDFQDSVQGNLNRREITFGEATKTVYAPVANWDAKLDGANPKTLGPEGMVLDAKFLTIRQMPGRTPTSNGWMELEASGNVLAEGAQFVAVGHRATYSEDKDLLVLEGDGRSPAELRYAQIPGARPTDVKVNRISYNLGLNHVQLHGAQSLEVDVLQPAAKPKEQQPPQLPPPPQ